MTTQEAFDRLTRPILLVGAGNMGGALLRGWLAAGLGADRLIVRDPSPKQAVAREIAAHGVRLNFTEDALIEADPAAVVLAVKPQLLPDVLADMKPLGGDRLFVSIAAGTKLATLAETLGAGPKVRAMPNTAAEIGRGVTGLVANDEVSAAQRELATALFAAVGQAVWVETERQIDMVTAISGSGPAYVFYLAECLTAAGEALGLPKEAARQLAEGTVSGAGDLIRVSEEPSAQLRRNVTSPNGTTEAALNVLMNEGGLAPLIRRTTEAAYGRARELGGESD